VQKLNCLLKEVRLLNENTKKALNEIEWDQDNTTGPKSISKQELMKRLNQIKVNLADTN